MPRDELWDRAVPRLAQRFFVINNIDRSSGLINVSYSGSPMGRVDCGAMRVRTNFNTDSTVILTAADSQYVGLGLGGDGGAVVAQFARRVSLEGRMNLVFQAEGPASTRVAVNSRYILTATTQQLAPPSFFGSQPAATVGFNSNEAAYLPGPAGAPAARCVATGWLEESVLEALR